MQLEIEGETREVDEDKIERLVKYENAVLNNEVETETPNKHYTPRYTCRLHDFEAECPRVESWDECRPDMMAPNKYHKI